MHRHSKTLAVVKDAKRPLNFYFFMNFPAASMLMRRCEEPVCTPTTLKMPAFSGTLALLLLFSIATAQEAGFAAATSFVTLPAGYGQRGYRYPSYTVSRGKSTAKMLLHTVSQLSERSH